MTISASNGVGLLQMVIELDVKRCASEDVEPWWGGYEAVYQQGRETLNGLGGPTSIEEGNKCQWGR